MTTDVVIIGTGGQGRECLDIALAMKDDGAALNVVGFVDDSPSAMSLMLVEQAGYPYLGTVEEFVGRARQAQACIGIGNGVVRKAIDLLISSAGLKSVTLVHPSSTLGSLVSIGDGSVIWPGARLTTNIKVGRHVHINQNSTVGHDTLLADYVTLNPLAAVSGGVEVSPGSTIGAGAVVLQGLSIGAESVVGASACVIRDVAPGVVVKGVPAK